MKSDSLQIFIPQENPFRAEGSIEDRTEPTDWQALYWEARRERDEAETRVLHLNRVLAGLRDGFVMLDNDLRYRYINPFTLKLMGKSEDQILGKSFFDLYPDLRETPYGEGLVTALREQHPVEVDIFYPNNNRYWRTLINPTSEGLTVYYRDVTELRAAEIIQQRLVAIIHSSEDAIIGKTLDGIITNWNPAAERIFGYSAGEVIGKPKTLLFPPDRLEEEIVILERLRQGISTDQFETIRIRKDGVPIYVSLTISPIRDGTNQIIGASTIARDISKRKKTEIFQKSLAEAGDLLASSLDYQTTLQSVAQSLVPQLADWCVVHLLNSREELEEVCVAHVDPAKREFAREHSRRYPPNPKAPTGPYAVMRSGKSEWSVEITDSMIRAAVVDEEQHRILIQLGMKSYISVPLTAQGKSLGVITMIAGDSMPEYTLDDVAFAEEIARRAALAVQNSRLYRAEQERSKQLTQAVSEVHHRVKNSLQSVSALLEMQMPFEGNSIPREAVQDSLYQIKTIALVHDLLARDRPIGTVDIAKVLTNLGSLLSSSMTAGRQHITIQVEVEPLEMSTRTATSLALVVNELLTNAAKHHSPPTDGNQPASLARDDIRVKLRKSANTVCVSIQDAGAGFAPDFDPVLHASIGLQVVQTLVEHDLHGTIHFDNVKNRDNPDEILGGYVEIIFPTSACIEE